MSSLELSGYIQIVVGVVGIIVTLLAAPSFLDGISKIRKGGTLPPEFDGVGGALRVFAIIAVLLVLLFMVAVGLVVTLSTLTVAMGAVHPHATSACLIAALLFYTVTLTLVAYRQPLWLPAFVGGCWLLAYSLIAALTEDLSLLILMAIPFAFAFVISGVAALNASR
jgi:hypothetical protein